MTPQTPNKATKANPAAPIGGYVLKAGDIEINADRRTVKLTVKNTGDRPIQVGSHFHFFEVNRALDFDRTQAFGMHLDIAASTAIRFEPGDQKEVQLVEFNGKRALFGFNNLVDGWTGPGPTPSYHPRYVEALRRASEYGFKTVKK